MIKKIVRKKKVGEHNKAEKLKDLIVKSLERDKAEEITVIDLKDKTDFAYYMVIASGRSTRHVSSLAEKICKDLKEKGFYDIKTEGLKEAKWVLVDALDVVVHIFLPEARESYGLEKIWGFNLPENSKEDK